MADAWSHFRATYPDSPQSRDDLADLIRQCGLSADQVDVRFWSIVGGSGWAGGFCPTADAVDAYRAQWGDDEPPTQTA